MNENKAQEAPAVETTQAPAQVANHIEVPEQPVADAGTIIPEQEATMEVVNTDHEVAEPTSESPQTQPEETTSEVVVEAQTVAEETVEIPVSVEAETVEIPVTAEVESELQPADAVQESAPTLEEIVTQSVETMQEELAAEQIHADYSAYTKSDFVALLAEQLAKAKSEGAKPSDLKAADEVLKVLRPLMDQIRRVEKSDALKKYVIENGSEEGFEMKDSIESKQFDELFKQIRDVKTRYFQDIERNKDKNFGVKTALIQRLRELVEADENSSGGNQLASFNDFKQVQDEWKAAGNIASPHNATLWATYHALVDRYYSNRNIYYELKDLDRKKNATHKAELCEKVEALAQTVANGEFSRAAFDSAVNLFEEYKQVGPAPKAEQEVLWQRFKVALDVFYDKRRGQLENQKQDLAATYEAKSAIYESLLPYTSYTSNSINDWNDKSREVMAIQEKWNGLKGAMPREDGKELSRKFWASLKVFFANKTDFFRQLEQKREENLKLKTSLCEQVEAIVASEQDTAENTNAVIELQKQWKQVGQVSDKVRESIFQRFKKACDAYFDRKRNKNSETDLEFEGNLTRKNALITKIEALATAGGATIEQLNGFKSEWSKIGFVPKKDMQSIGKRYIAAINAYVASMGGTVSVKDRERAMQSNNESSSFSGGGSDAARPQRKEGDVRKRLTNLENDIALWQNNIEFFAKSKSSEKLRGDFQRKIDNGQKEIDDLKKQLKTMRETNP